MPYNLTRCDQELIEMHAPWEVGRGNKLLIMCVVIGQIVNRRGSFRHFRNEKGTGSEMRPAIVSGIVTGDAPVSY